jgi:hypothetical protein
MGNNWKADIQNCSEPALSFVLLPEISHFLPGYRKCINDFHVVERQVAFNLPEGL